MRKPLSVLLVCAVMATCAMRASAAEGEPVVPMKAAPVVSLQARAFPRDEVRLLDGPFLHAQEMGRKYLLELEPDRLLAPCYEAIGLTPRKPRYGGWEAQGISGHMLGHWLSAAARMTGDDPDGREIKRRLDYVVGELAALQAKRPDGYVSGFPHKPFDEVFSGTFEVQAFSLGHHWVPWYTMHKIFAGLIDAYEIAGNAQALEVAAKLADWAKAGTDKLNDQQFQRMLQCEQGGMSESMAELYAITGQKKYLDLAERFTHHAILDPLAAGRDQLSGKHANTQIPKIVGAARIYELTGKDYYQNVASYFWNQVTDKRSYAFGGNSIREHFPQLGAEPLGPATAETCNTYNMLRLTKELMTWKPDPRYGDFYERALYNQILGSQDPDTGLMMYFMSTKPGHFKVYCTPFDSMWCCTGSGLENPGRYTEGIYFHNADTLWVNLYIPSELQWKQKGLILRQETTFPEMPRTKFTVASAPSGPLTLQFRVPYWAAKPVVARVNGQEVARAAAGPGWLALNRPLAKGDVIELDLPMNLHLHPAEDNPNLVAILCGPVVLAGRMGRENFPADDHYKDQNAPNNLPAPPAPILVSPSENPADWIIPAGAPLAFKTSGVGRPADVELVPFYQIHHERYTVYFERLAPDAWASREKEVREKETAQRELERRTVDQINPGEQQPDIDHQMKGEKSNAGAASGRSWRDARDGGWFSYRMKVANGPLLLRVTYWGGETGDRAFEILVNGEKVGQQKLANDKPGEFFDVDYALPESLTRGKNELEVKFQAKAGNIAGGVFGLRMMRKEP